MIRFFGPSTQDIRDLFTLQRSLGNLASSSRKHTCKASPHDWQERYAYSTIDVKDPAQRMEIRLHWRRININSTDKEPFIVLKITGSNTNNPTNNEKFCISHVRVNWTELFLPSDEASRQRNCHSCTVVLGIPPLEIETESRALKLNISRVRKSPGCLKRSNRTRYRLFRRRIIPNAMSRSCSKSDVNENYFESFINMPLGRACCNQQGQREPPDAPIKPPDFLIVPYKRRFLRIMTAAVSNID
jgi:hypothetical protein